MTEDFMLEKELKTQEKKVSPHLHPNRISAYGPVLTLASLVALNSNLTSDFAPGLFLAGAISDSIDGKVAREYGLMTREGAKLDPLMDKAKNFMVGSYMIYKEYANNWGVVLTNMANFGVDVMSQKYRGSLISQLKEATKAVWHPYKTNGDTSKKSNMRANYYGKAKTIIQSIAHGAYITAAAYHDSISSFFGVSQNEVSEFTNDICVGLLTVSAILGTKGIYNRVNGNVRIQ